MAFENPSVSPAGSPFREAPLEALWPHALAAARRGAMKRARVMLGPGSSSSNSSSSSSSRFNQTFQVPKMEGFLNLIFGYFGDGFSLT